MFKYSSLNRRRFLCTGLSLLTGAGAIAIGKDKYGLYDRQEIDNLKRDLKVVGEVPLKERAAAKGLIYGAAVTKDYLQSNAKLKASFVRECGILVPENELKWDALRPTPKKFEFTRSDWLAQFAKANGMLFRGHTLVWHQQLPQWFKEVVNRQNAEKFLYEHITTVTKRYAGVTHSWDVVNEAIEPSHGRLDGWRKTPWLELLGRDYIELAFRMAAAADPKAMLVYNELGLDSDTRTESARRTAVLRLLERLKSRGTPIHALGMQSHLLGDQRRFDRKKLRSFLADVASLGLSIIITELDVVDKKLPLDLAARDRIIAARYKDYLSVVLDEKAVIGVLTWGLSDKYSWLEQFYPRSDGAAVRPLPLDSNMKPKLAWNAIAKAFEQAPKRNAPKPFLRKEKILP